MAEVLRNIDVVKNPYRYGKSDAWLEEVKKEMDMILDMACFTEEDKVRIISKWFWEPISSKCLTPLKWWVSKT